MSHHKYLEFESVHTLAMLVRAELRVEKDGDVCCYWKAYASTRISSVFLPSRYHYAYEKLYEHGN